MTSRSLVPCLKPRIVSPALSPPNVAPIPTRFFLRVQKSQGFKRNDHMPATPPIGVIVFPGSGISANLADKARMLGILVWKFIDGGVSARQIDP